VRELATGDGRMAATAYPTSRITFSAFVKSHSAQTWVTSAFKCPNTAWEAGKWPTSESGTLAHAPGESWQAIARALYAGQRGLPGGSTLARLLAAYRGVRNRKGAAPLTLKKILAWADVHFRRTGVWPHARIGRIVEVPGDTWLAVDRALRREGRSWRGRTTLARLLAQHRDVRPRRPTRPRRRRRSVEWITRTSQGKQSSRVSDPC
jgi:hypothetical protein